MLGAHGMRNKFTFLEEAVRVPMAMSLPNSIPAGTIVTEPVSHVDLFATILDYTGASDFDRSDGSTLRRFIEHSSFNQFYDEATVVAELDDRWPTGSYRLSGDLGDIPNFMIRKDHWKLMLPKKRGSKVLDQLYNLRADPYEMNNLLGVKGSRASEAVIGKVEQLKILLLEWMRRHDTNMGFYSNKKYNLGQGMGDIAEIKGRRTWRKLDFWLSDRMLTFGNPVFSNGRWRRREYIYIGRTTPGKVSIRDISIRGPDAGYFKIYQKRAVLKQNQYLRIQVTFSTQEKDVNINSLNAWLQIVTDAKGYLLRKVILAGDPSSMNGAINEERDDVFFKLKAQRKFKRKKKKKNGNSNSNSNNNNNKKD